MGQAELFAAVAVAALCFLIFGGCVAWLIRHPTVDCPVCGKTNEGYAPHCRVCGCPLKSDSFPR